MKQDDTTVTINIEIKPKLSWIDALKLRLAGGKAARAFWDSLAAKVSERIE